jgi:hypothetical protein
VPKGFDEWFARCSHKDPGRRFLSIAEAADILCFVSGLEPDTVVVPQLYSEPPPSAHGNLRVARRSLPSGVSTNAPATISLSHGIHVKRGRRWTKAVAGGLIAAGAGLAILARLGHDAGSAPASALQPQGVESSFGPEHEFDVDAALQTPSNGSAQTSALVLRASRTGADSSLVAHARVTAQEPYPRLEVKSLSGAGSSASTTNVQVHPPIDEARAGTGVGNANPGQRQVATTVESAIGLRRRP